MATHRCTPNEGTRRAKRKAEKRLVANVKSSEEKEHITHPCAHQLRLLPGHSPLRCGERVHHHAFGLTSSPSPDPSIFEGGFEGAHPIRFSRKGASFSPLASRLRLPRLRVVPCREREAPPLFLLLGLSVSAPATTPPPPRERKPKPVFHLIYRLGIERLIEMAVEKGAAAALFGEEELRDVSGVRVGDRFVEVTCGCTSARYGDAVGLLRVFASGELEVCCDCTPGCDEDKLSPAAFEKHSGRETAGRWQNTVWVIVKGDKVALSKTCLLKYYHEKLKSANGGNGNGGRRPPCHRDEFVRCASCGKERRFRLRSKEECRLYHDAAARHDWTCKDMAPAGRVSCEDEEERASRRASRGCARAATCKGCVRCVCFGCETCRFAGCGCQTCVDFYRINP